MSFHLTKRSITRIISFSAALILVLFGSVIKANNTAKYYRFQLENSYYRALGELSGYLLNISADLQKGRYASTSGQLALLSARVWKECGGAKAALSTLPVSEIHMDNTYKFLSQAGDYAMSLSRKAATGAEPTDTQRQNAAILCRYAKNLSSYVSDIQQQISDGQINVSSFIPSKRGSDDQTAGTHTSDSATGFEDIEQTMIGFPTLIYDGPFSDHLLSRIPRMTHGAESVTAIQAKEIAAQAASLAPGDVSQTDDENSTMPSYVFTAPNLSIAITKSGGFLSYLVSSREISDERMRQDAIMERAGQFLLARGLKDMHATYYESADGICTINYAAVENGIILYTDLVKVGVALDDGGIVYYDARGYLVNHGARALTTPKLSAKEASESISGALTIVGQGRLALIPTSGKNEVLTYEFQCTANDDPKQRVLVYVNANNGAEENILLLVKTQSGTLTK